MGVSRNINESYKIPLPRRKQVCFCGERWKCFFRGCYWLLDSKRKKAPWQNHRALVL